MSLTTEGIYAEKKARELLKRNGYQLQQADWIGKKDGKYTIFEVKERELFAPPPFLGTGLDKSQVYLRTQLLEDLGLRTYLIVFEKNTSNVYGQWLDKLEQTTYFDTKNGIRVYNIKEFVVLNNK